MTSTPQEAPESPDLDQGPPSVAKALEGALEAARLGDEDQAAVALARTYAAAIDSFPATLLDKSVGRDFLAVLQALGLTPAARKAVSKGGVVGAVASPLDELRARRKA